MDAILILIAAALVYLRVVYRVEQERRRTMFYKGEL